MGRPKKEQTVVVYARIPEQLAVELREEAYNDGRELSATIRLILENRHSHDGGLEIIQPKPRVTQRQAEQISHSAGETDAIEANSSPEREVSHSETVSQSFNELGKTSSKRPRNELFPATKFAKDKWKKGRK